MISERLKNLQQSDIRAMTLENNKVGGINLGQGVCDMPTPTLVESGAIQAIKERKSTYSPAGGIPELRERLVGKLRDENGIQTSAENIIITAGTTGGYCATLSALFNPGDEVILFEPYYGYHLNSARILGVESRTVPLKLPSLELDIDRLKEAITPKTKAIVLCTPANPSGKMFTREEIELIGEVASENNLLILSDEIYEYFTYDNREHISPASIEKLKERTITLMGFSKTFSITGWRLGYIVVPDEYAQTITLANDLLYVCAPTPLQHAVLSGMNEPKSYYTNLKSEFSKKREVICNALLDGGFEVIKPQGAYYVLADHSSFGFSDSHSAAMKILESVKVTGVPGRAFFSSPAGENYVRFCYSVEDGVLTEACQRLSSFKGVI